MALQAVKFLIRKARCKHILLNFPIIVGVLGFTMESRRPLEVSICKDTEKWKLFPSQMAGAPWRIIQSKSNLTFRKRLPPKFFITSKLRYVNGHNLIGLDNGAMILAGGEITDENGYSADYSRKIWMLKNNQWSLVGHLKEVKK